MGWRMHSLVAEMHVGVTVFFVLSGFLIGYRYLGQERVPLRTYFANRFARIYPMYFLLTTATFLIIHQADPASNLGDFKTYLLNITFLRGLFEEFLYTGIKQGWSLTVEEMFYVSAPLAFWLIRRNARWLGALPLGLVLLGVGLVLACRGQAWHGFFGSFDFLFQFTYLGRAVEFFVGVALAWWLRRPGPHAAPRFLTYAGLAGCALCLTGLSLLHGPAIGAFGVMQPAGMLLNNVLLPVLGIGPLLWGLVRETTWLSRLLSSPPLLLLGKSSYVFYLLHMGVLQHLIHNALQNDVLTVLALYAVSIGLYRLVEEPLNHWLRRVLRQPARPVAALAR
ncbi:acyltransferase family protein [Hymenobacter negativus]|uniref:acyltransferase family protein n=1 Tax=Hymenobacter negativus TaxID=2795026 RepID=UPI0018DB1FF2|nr:acyltransferase [Hymenobacter negativus]MBH8568129.1 acyltransferase [Hymenobacter negativus]